MGVVVRQCFGRFHSWPRSYVIRFFCSDAIAIETRIAIKTPVIVRYTVSQFGPVCDHPSSPGDDILSPPLLSAPLSSPPFPSPPLLSGLFSTVPLPSSPGDDISGAVGNSAEETTGEGREGEGRGGKRSGGERRGEDVITRARRKGAFLRFPRARVMTTAVLRGTVLRRPLGRGREGK